MTKGQKGKTYFENMNLQNENQSDFTILFSYTEVLYSSFTFLIAYYQTLGKKHSKTGESIEIHVINIKKKRADEYETPVIKEPITPERE